MSRIFPIFLILSFLLTPISAGAQESQEHTEPAEIPVYLFIAENGDVLGLAPISEEVAVGCLASSNSPENPQETPETPECFLLSLAPPSSIIPQTPEAGVERPIFTGHEYDDDTDLSYMVARYYDGSVGRFNSQDPVFLAMGTNDPRVQQILLNPQELNSYSYTANNPLRYIDPDGEATVDVNLSYMGPLVGPISAGVDIGLTIEFYPNFGAQYNADLSVGVGQGLSLQAQIDPSGTLDPKGEYAAIELVIAKGLYGGAASNQVNYEPGSFPAFFSEESETSIGLAVGGETSASYSHNYVGEPHYFFSMEELQNFLQQIRENSTYYDSEGEAQIRPDDNQSGGQSNDGSKRKKQKYFGNTIGDHAR